MASPSSFTSSNVTYEIPDPHRAPDWLRSVTLGETKPDAGPACPRRDRTEVEIRECDALAVSLSAAMRRLTVPLARAASAFRKKEGWSEFGYARVRDYTRERTGFSAPWFGGLASVGDRIEDLPEFLGALIGEDGSKPIRRAAAISIAGVVTAESLAAWLELARRLNPKDLRSAVSRAKKAGSKSPVEATSGRPEASVEDISGEPEDSHPDDERYVRMMVPAAVVSAFEEVLDLYRAVEGGESTIRDFVEALVGDAAAGPAGHHIEMEVMSLRRVEGRAAIEAALARSTENWSRLPGEEETDWTTVLAGATLAQFLELCERAGKGDVVELDDQVRQLAGLEHELSRRLGEIIARLGRLDGWKRLGFDSARHYAEARLGQGRTAMEDRARLHRSLARLEAVREAYTAGDIVAERARIIARLLREDTPSLEVQTDWVQRAKEATIKRMKDELKAVIRKRGLHRATPGAKREAPVPMSDPEWHQSIRRDPGMAKERVAKLGDIAASSLMSEVLIRLRLPQATTGRLLSAMTAARDRLAALVAEVPWDQPWPDPKAPGSVKAAREFFVRCRRIPLWVGLLAMLEDFADTRDVSPEKKPDEILCRDGWRCGAPGCGSRRNNQIHHVEYKSHGGGEAEWNKLDLCAWHHLRGEHQGLASVRGRAPLDLVWKLGRDGIGGTFQNERSL